AVPFFADVVLRGFLGDFVAISTIAPQLFKFYEVICEIRSLKKKTCGVATIIENLRQVLGRNKNLAKRNRYSRGLSNSSELRCLINRPSIHAPKEPKVYHFRDAH